MTRPFIQDFAHEAWNSDKAKSDFAPLTGKTAIYVPEVLWAEKRCMVMECESRSRTLARPIDDDAKPCHSPFISYSRS